MSPRGATAAARGAAAPRRRPARGVRTAPAAPRVAPPLVPRAPRRVSGPGRRTAPAHGLPRGARALLWLRELPDHRLVDRLVRGRAWIVLVGFLLIGIVAMQVSLLKLNASIGRAVEQGSTLERRNGELRAAVSRLSAEDRIQRMGTKLGLVMPEAGQITYLSTRGRQDAGDAAQALRAGRLGTAAPTAAAPTAADAGAAPAAPTDSSSATYPSAAPADSAPATDATAAPAGGDTSGVAAGDAPAPGDGSASGSGQ